MGGAGQMGVGDGDIYIVFRKSDFTFPFMRFLNNKYNHCLCFIDFKGSSLVLNYNGSNLEVYKQEMGAEDLAKGYKLTGAKVVKASKKEKAHPKIRFGGFIYCVGVVKSILSIHECAAFTPFGLYKWLIKNGYEEI